MNQGGTGRGPNFFGLAIHTDGGDHSIDGDYGVAAIEVDPHAGEEVVSAGAIAAVRAIASHLSAGSACTGHVLPARSSAETATAFKAWPGPQAAQQETRGAARKRAG